MIELFRPAASDLADLAEETLQDLVVMHAVHTVDGDPAGLPRVHDGNRVVPADQIPDYLDELRRTVADWRRFQSDACYIGDDGAVC